MILKVLCCLLQGHSCHQASKEILEATTLRSILSKDLGDSELDVTEDWDFSSIRANQKDLSRGHLKWWFSKGLTWWRIFRLSQKTHIGCWTLKTTSKIQFEVFVSGMKKCMLFLVQHRYLLKCLKYCPSLQDATVLELMQKRLASKNMSMLCPLVECFFGLKEGRNDK